MLVDPNDPYGGATVTAARNPQLPQPPPSLKRPTPFDADHRRETLLQIGSALLSNQDFGQGLGAAASSLAGRLGDIRKEAMKSTTYGGPDDQFEITTDAYGNRTVRKVPEFAQAVADKQTRRTLPDAKDNADLRGRALYAISQLDPKDQPAAYADLKTNGKAYGIDTTDLPDQWSQTFGRVAGSMGMNVSQSVAAGDRGKRTDSYVETNKARVGQGEARLGLSRNADARADAKASGPRSAPPSVRKGYSSPRSRDEFNALPSGSKFVAPDGSLRIKP
jgi:hypothetical protein